MSLLAPGILAVALLAGTGPAPGRASAPTPPSVGDLRRSGTVHLETSCTSGVRDDFDTAVALLHSFFYDEARRRFDDIAARDPGCAMAWWGKSMTWYHPLWAPPTPAEMAEGVKAVDTAKRIGGKTEIERGMIAAIDAYFHGEDAPPDPKTAETAPAVAPSCHGPRENSSRAGSFKAAWEELHRAHPDDLEVTIFYALSLLATAPPTDKTYANQLAAAAILEPLSRTHPDHPGIPHYLIHAYDYPPLAARGLEAARRYGEIAPWVPHALHMPSHIFTRLGMWDDSIQANLASAAAAREYTARLYGGATWYDELHALDYALFAYLQTAQDRKAAQILERVEGLRKFQDPNFAAAYALGAMPARFALERRRWKDAAALTVRHPDVMNAYPFALAHIEFAHAVGGAKSGRIDLARTSVQRLAELRDALELPKFKWWTDQIEIQRLAGAAWLARAEKKNDEAIRLLTEASALEDRAGTHPVTPGQILPAHEQLGDLLMELDRASEALAQYEASLQAFPNRFNSHYGAAVAAHKAGKTDIARQHARLLLEMAGSGDGRRGEIARMRSLVKAG